MSHPLLPAAAGILAELVAFNSESSRSNIPLVRRVEEMLAADGVAAKTLLDAGGEKISLLASIGPETAGGIILSGHTDVVSAENQTWQTPPFEMAKKDGKLFGRGTCDMKGFIACVLAQVPAFVAAGLRVPAHIALSRDEELGCRGMPDMLRLIEREKISAAAAIVGEPTMMRVVGGHKGGCEQRTVFCGVPAHSGTPEAGTSAVLPAAKFINFLAAMEEEMRAAPQKDSPFIPPHGLINVGVVNGGEAVNIVPGRCEVVWHCRTLPESSPVALAKRAIDFAEQTLLPEMQKSGYEVSISTVTESSYPGLVADENSAAVQLAKKLTGESETAVAPYGADAGSFAEGGIPAVLVGPGDIAQAHKADEFVALAQLEKCLFFLDDLRAEMAREGEK